MNVLKSLQRTGQHARSASEILLSAWRFVYLDSCPRCGFEEFDAPRSFRDGPTLCQKCEKDVAPQIGRPCARCGAPVGPHVDSTQGCYYCRRDKFRFEQVIRLGIYDGPLREVCLQGKTVEGQPVVSAAADLLWRREHVALESAKVDVVCSVPRHWTDRVGRPSHTSATLATILARRLNVGEPLDALKKTRRTLVQSGLSATKRRVNVKGAYGARRGYDLTGTTVLLVDDVLTTGATADECARMLRQAGAARVVVAVLARGLGR